MAEPPPKRTKVSESEIIQPYTHELKYDEKLQLSRNDLFDVLLSGKIEPISKIRTLNERVYSFPDLYRMALFANKAYEDQERETHETFEKRLDLPDGWKLLVKALNKERFNGFHATAFWNPATQQIVIANRGTAFFTNLGSVATDILSIFGNLWLGQIFSAITFAHKVYDVIRNINQDYDQNFQLLFTGHSLGGWLSQITTFTTKYLKLYDLKFLWNKENDGYHAHTVVFESPGCQKMLTKIYDLVRARYGQECLASLDITNILASPNIFNCVNLQVQAQILRVFPIREEDKNYVQKALSLVKSGLTSLFPKLASYQSHSLEGILKVLSSSKSSIKFKKVIDWPKIDLSHSEFGNFIKWAQKFQNYDPNDEDEFFNKEVQNHEGFNFIRYQTKRYHDNECPVSVFVKEEADFLQYYQWLRDVPQYCDSLRLFDPIETSKNKVDFIRKKLKRYRLDKQMIKFKNSDEMHSLIPFVKTLVKLCPGLTQKAQKSLRSGKVQISAYKKESAKYLKYIIPIGKNFNENSIPELISFLENTEQRLWQLVVHEDTDLVAARLHQTLQQSSLKKDLSYFMELQTIMTLDKHFKLSILLKSDELSKVVFVIECASEVRDSKPFFERVLQLLKEHNECKMIFICRKNELIVTELNELLKKINPNYYLRTKQGVVTWNDLSCEFREKITSQNLIIFQGSNTKICLNKLLFDKNIEDYKILNIVDSKAIGNFIKNEPIRLGNSIENMQERVKHYISRRFYMDDVSINILTLDSSEDLLAVSQTSLEELINSGVEQNRVCQFSNVNHTKIIVLNSEKSEKQFKELCIRYPKQNIHWLELFNANLRWIETQGSLNVIREYLDILDKQFKVSDSLDSQSEPPKFYWKRYEDRSSQSDIGDSQPTDDSMDDLSEDNLVKTKFIVISDTPGMGKSTILTSLATKFKKVHRESWVVRLDLNNCAKTFKEELKKRENNAGFDCSSLSEAVDFLIQLLQSNETSRLKSSFEIEIFKFSLLKAGGLVLLIDAVDEISPKYEKVFLEILNALKQSRVKNVVVTTRKNDVQKQIEDTLVTFSYHFEPFSKNEQVKYLSNFWLEKIQSKINLTRVARVFITEISEIIFDDEEDFMGTPLQCKHCAEICINLVKSINVVDQTDQLQVHNIKSAIKELFKKPYILNIYDELLKKRYQLFTEEKCNDAQGKLGNESIEGIAFEQLQEYHEQLAVEMLIGEKYFKALQIRRLKKQNIEKHLELALRVGVIVKYGNDLSFIHQTFAEYFLSRFLADAMKDGFPETGFQILNMILTRAKFDVVRMFLNCQLNKVDSDFVNKFGEFMLKNWLENPHCMFDEFNETSLYKAAQYKLENIFKLLVDCCLKDENTARHMANYIGAYSALDVAIKNKSSEIQPFFLKIREFSEQTQRVLLLATTFNLNPHKQLLEKWEDHYVGFLVHKMPSINTIKKVHRFVVDGKSENLIKELNKFDEDCQRYILLASNDSNETALHLALKHGHLEVAKILVQEYKTLIPDLKYSPLRPILYSAVISEKLEIVKFVMDNGLFDAHVMHRDWLTMTSIINLKRDDILSEVLDKCPRVARMRNKSQTLLKYSLKYGNEKISSLLEHKIAVHAGNNEPKG